MRRDRNKTRARETPSPPCPQNLLRLPSRLSVSHNPLENSPTRGDGRSEGQAASRVPPRAVGAPASTPPQERRRGRRVAVRRRDRGSPGQAHGPSARRRRPPPRRAPANPSPAPADERERNGKTSGGGRLTTHRRSKRAVAGRRGTAARRSQRRIASESPGAARARGEKVRNGNEITGKKKPEINPHYTHDSPNSNSVYTVILDVTLTNGTHHNLIRAETKPTGRCATREDETVRVREGRTRRCDSFARISASRRWTRRDNGAFG